MEYNVIPETIKQRGKCDISRNDLMLTPREEKSDAENE